MASELLHYQEWGSGDPVIALHPLALESSAFAGLAAVLAERSLRTLAVDLPGFGRSPAPDEPLSPARLAGPVLELARSLERPPLLVGMSLGARVALEAALLEPRAVRGVVAVVPFLPWRRWRVALGATRWLDPDWAERLPLERLWPALRLLAQRLERRPDLEHDWLGRAAARAVYAFSCPATRRAFLSATREMALDPAFGAQGLWTRLVHLAPPASFVWAGRDALVPRSHRESLRRVLPGAPQLEVACAGHFVSAGHFSCMIHGIALAVARSLEAGSATQPGAHSSLTLAPCLVGGDTAEPTPSSASERESEPAAPLRTEPS
jgi:pimeloyl-ACP methyl ester carboxylesterase